MRFKTLVVFGGLLILGFVALAIRRQVREGYEVHYIVPAGYHGVLVGRAKMGAPALPFSHGSYTITLPKNGVLETASTEVFYEWHHVSAAFDDGTPLGVAVVPPDPTPTKSPTVEFYDLGVEDELVYWFVGTHDEFAEMQGKLFHDYLTPAQKAILRPLPALK